MHAFVKERIDQLRKEAIILNKRSLKPHVRTYTPLREQIIGLISEMPSELQDRSWSIIELVRQLKGRYRAHPHSQMVARELTALGWQRTRIWTTEGRGSRIWHPPMKVTLIKSTI